MKREFTAPVFAFITALILVLSVALPSGILPDKSGNSLLLQASRFEKGEITAPVSDTVEKNGQFYKIYTAGYMLGSVEKVFTDGTAWKFTALLCVLFSAYLIFLTLSSFSPKKKALYVPEPCKSVFFRVGIRWNNAFYVTVLVRDVHKNRLFFEMVSCVAHIGVYVCGFAVFVHSFLCRADSCVS